MGDNVLTRQEQEQEQEQEQDKTRQDRDKTRDKRQETREAEKTQNTQRDAHEVYVGRAESERQVR